MADRRLAIEITVEGDAKSVFKEIGAAAKQSAKDVVDSGQRAEQGIERIEKAAEQAEKEVKELGQTQERVAKSAEALENAQAEAAKATRDMAQHSAKAGTSLDQYRRAIGETAKGVGLLSTAFTLYARQARDHEINVMALNRIYGEAADSYMQLADRIQGTTIFSNDQAVEAARSMGTLRENYDLTDQQVQQLISTSADLAAMHGMTLTDAAMRVQSAIRGEAESAEALGLTMNQAAIDAEGLTLSMSNAEAAQFRFNAMMQQTASSVGFAAEAADNNTGKIIRLANETQDAAIAFIRFTGPVGDVAAGLGQFGIQGGAAALGLIQLGRGISAAAAAAGGMTALLGPAGLIILGLSAAAVATKLFADSMRDEAAEAMKRARVEGEQLDSVISSVTANLSGVDRTFAEAIIGSDDALDRMQEHIDYWQSLIETWGNFPVDRLHLSAETIAGLDEEVQASIETQRQAIAYMQQYADEFGSVEQAANALAEAERDLSTILQHRGAGRTEILTQLADLNEAYQSGKITISEYVAALDALEKQRFKIDNDVILDQLEAEQAALIEQQTVVDATTHAWTDYEQAMNQAALASVANAQAIQLQRTALQELNGALQLLPSGEEGYGNRFDVGPFARRYASMGQTAIDATKLAMDAMVLAISGGESAWNKYAGALGVVTRETEELGTAHTQLTADMKGEDIARVTAEYEAAARAASGLSDTLYGLQARGGSVSVDLAINTGGARDALQSGYGAVIGGSEGMGRLADQTAEWAASLTEGNIGQSKLDDLLLKGAISQTTYRRALEANHRIQIANQSVQEDVLRIQAKQLPAMAELAESHARYVDSLADASVQEQAAALGFMDQSKAAQAVAVANMNATAAMAGTSEQAGKMTIAMAEADPYLRAMLLQMGVIEEGADGEITMNTDDAVSATDILSELNTTIGDLKTLLAQIFLVQVDIEDNASGSLSYIDGLLSQLDGKTANVYINTLGGNTIGFTPGAATGEFIYPESARNLVAKVDGMATGGHLRLVGEAGPELVQLPTGSTVTNAAGTRGRLDPQGRGRRSAGGGDVYNGTVHMTVVRDDSALTHRQRELAKRRR